MTDIQCLCTDCQFNEDECCGKSEITIGDMTECWMYETREDEESEDIRNRR